MGPNFYVRTFVHAVHIGHWKMFQRHMLVIDNSHVVHAYIASRVFELAGMCMSVLCVGGVFI